MTRSCPTCSSEFTVPERIDKVYCSKRCSNARPNRPERPSKKIVKTCPACQGEFRVPPSRHAAICCSRACYNKHFFTGRPKRTLKAKPSRARKMSDVEAAWLAGLFDGEGSIVLASRSRPGGGTVHISIVNTVKPLLDEVERVTGTGRTRCHRKDNPRHADVYTWHAYAATAIDLLEQMRPWLIVKAERADAVFAGTTFPRQSRWDHIYPEAS